MQALMFNLKCAVSSVALVLGLLASGCGEKSPEQIAAENRAETEMSVRRARVLMFEDKSADAVALLEQTYQKCGATPDLCESLAYAYAQNGQPASAAMFFENASALKKGDPELQISAAKSYEQSKAYESAANAYKKYLKLKPSDLVAWKSLSECYKKLEKYTEALNSYMGALKISGRNPNTAEAAEIGELFVKIGNAVQARKWLEAAYQATLPENLDTRKKILAGLITVYLAQKETTLLDKTVKELDKIDAKYIDESYPQLRAQLSEYNANILAAENALKADTLKKKAEEQAKADAEAKAAQEAKDKADAEAKAKAEAQKKAEEKAAANEKSAPENQPAQDIKDQTQTPALDNAKPADTVIKDTPVSDEPQMEVEPTNYDGLVKQCYNAVESGDAKAAERAAHKAIALDRNRADAWRALAKAYEMSNKNNDSYMAATEAYVRNPDDIDATLFYLRNAARVLNNEKFLNKVYIAHEKFPNNPEIWVDLARTYNLLGDRRNAQYFYNLFVKETPKEHPLYRDMLMEYEELAGKTVE